MNVVIILLTYQRTDYAKRTVIAARNNLRYHDGELKWYLADDGSSNEHINELLDLIPQNELIGWHTIPNGSYGENANKAWHFAHEHSDVTLFLEDDWELQREFDITPHVRTLLNWMRVGMVRLGYLNLYMRGSLESQNNRLYWLLDRTADSYVFTGHPSLRHRRFREDYGAYPHGLKPGETELAYGLQFRNGHGSEIVYPVELGEYGFFGHIGLEQSYK